LGAAGVCSQILFSCVFEQAGVASGGGGLDGGGGIRFDLGAAELQLLEVGVLTAEDLALFHDVISLDEPFLDDANLHKGRLGGVGGNGSGDDGVGGNAIVVRAGKRQQTQKSGPKKGAPNQVLDSHGAITSSAEV